MFILKGNIFADFQLLSFVEQVQKIHKTKLKDKLQILLATMKNNISAKKICVQYTTN